jgi:DNA-binding NtrC family response regulator
MFLSDHRFTLLIVDDDPHFQILLKTIFMEENYKLQPAKTGEEAIKLLDNFRIDGALIDLKLPGIDGMTLLKEIKRIYPNIMITMITGQRDVQLAVEAIKAGADDFLHKPFHQEELRIRVNKMYQIWLLKEENNSLKLETKFSYDPLIGNSSSMVQLKKMITQVGPTDTSVLIQGETGTGKELVAKAVHHHSMRKNKPFVIVDCASISSTVIESELFGHTKGSFTGAINSATGLIRSADGGTLFFDEIGELDLSAQTKLLRVLQEREVRPLGSLNNFSVDIRVLAATNRNLRVEVNKKRFREDLFYRIQGITLEVPPLRIREKDIALLAEHFSREIRDMVNETNCISNEVLNLLGNFDWPGNIRELQNVIMSASTIRKHGQILLEDLPPFYTTADQNHGNRISYYAPDIYNPEDDEKNEIIDALRSCRGNRRKTAAILNIGEATLYRKIKKYKINNIGSSR